MVAAVLVVAWVRMAEAVVAAELERLALLAERLLREIRAALRGLVITAVLDQLPQTQVVAAAALARLDKTALQTLVGMVVSENNIRYRMPRFMQAAAVAVPVRLEERVETVVVEMVDMAELDLQAALQILAEVVAAHGLPHLAALVAQES